MREEIIKLRLEGKSYNEIVRELGCSKSTVSYHLGKGQKEAAKVRNVKSAERRIESKRASNLFVRKFIFRYKRVCGCSSCGENDPVVLDFDHKYQSEKLLNVSVLLKNRMSMDVIKSEIRKCVVLCANCHRKKTAKQLGWYKGF